MIAVSYLIIRLEKKAYYPGETVRGKMEYRFDKETHVNDLSIKINCEEATSIVDRASDSTLGYKESRSIFNQEITVYKKTSVPPGEKEFPFEFTLPQDALPSYKGHEAFVSYEVSAKADIPLAFDMHGYDDFLVLPDPKKVVKEQRSSILLSPNAVLKQGTANLQILQSNDKKPAFKIEIEKDALIAGEVLRGSLTVANLTSRLRKAVIRLYSLEKAYAEGHRSQTTGASIAMVEIPAETIKENSPITFQLEVSPYVPSSYQGRISSLEWLLECNLDISWALDVTAASEVVITNLSDMAEPPRFRLI
ncbi:MAG: sporulation protein [Thermoplasmata archaeon]